MSIARRLGPPPSGMAKKGSSRNMGSKTTNPAMTRAALDQKNEEASFKAIAARSATMLKTQKAKDEAKKDKLGRNPAGVKLPDSERASKGLSIKGLLRATPSYIKNSGDDVVIKQRKTTRTKGGMPAIVGITLDRSKKPAKPHQFSVVGVDKELDMLSKQKKVRVSCDCEFFMYNCEYSLWTWGATTIKYSNGKPAKVTNPANIPLVCKHLSAVLRNILERGD